MPLPKNVLEFPFSIAAIKNKQLFQMSTVYLVHIMYVLLVVQQETH